MGAWGAGAGWGLTGWGGGDAGDALQLLLALAIRENVVRLYFNTPPRFTELLDPSDAANPARYAVTPLDGTFGADELPTRAVSPALIAQVVEPGAAGTQIDVTVDRPFSPYPGRYRVSTNQLVTAAGGALLDEAYSSTVFDAVARGLLPPLPSLVMGRRDIANPQVLAAFTSAATDDEAAALLATFVVDETGDYATDQGEASYRKRVFRRLTTRKGRFAHLPTYGVGVPGAVKQIGRAGVREALAAEAEAQIRLEPETRDVQVTIERSLDRPELTILRVRARTIAGETMDMNVPYLPGA